MTTKNTTRPAMDAGITVADALASHIEELVLSLERAQAVLTSFAREYVDISDPSIFSALAMDSEHYHGLFEAFAYMLADIRRDTDVIAREAVAVLADRLEA